MDRRDSIKTLAISALAPAIYSNFFPKDVISQLLQPGEVEFNSEWKHWPDMKWIGPQYWGNRLQDWEIRNGTALCNITAKNRTLHLLTLQKDKTQSRFEISTQISLKNPEALDEESCIGFRIGAKGPHEDYRSAAVFGKGLDIGISANGKLKIGNKIIETSINTPSTPFILKLQAVPGRKNYRFNIHLLDSKTEEILFSEKNIPNPEGSLVGNFALISHFPHESNKSSVSFSNWQIKGEELYNIPKHAFGPVCFAQYTIHDKVLKLTAQLSPFEDIKNHKVVLQVKKNNKWETLSTKIIDNPGRALNFRILDWQYQESLPYRLKTTLPLKDNLEKTYLYEGTIAAEPNNKKEIKAAVFSCNCDYGFPDNDIKKHVSYHKPDIALFLGDQFYENTGGFGIQVEPFDKSCLDYLRKWMMFGWSYREIFRHIPCAIIPDDHDVYHGNLWGEGGKVAPTDEGWGAVAQDQGGYKMPAEWVNMVQFTQTSHLPDPYDPTPVKQNINVYYTHWSYAGISFAILEDRKFKSAPQNVLPEKADILNSFVQNPNFDLSQYSGIDADLLGERQLAFLEAWNRDWTNGVEMKAVLSQTNLCTVGTLPEGSTSGAIIPKLEIPKKGNYVKGDAPSADMDSNGWPQKGRDKAIQHIRKCFAFHIAGDQHLASMVHYGVEKFGDSGYAFAGPALNNIWPRRWWPPLNGRNHSLENPGYTGNFKDGFGNKMTVKAVANPHKTGVEPSIIHDRATGFGIITFNKDKRTINTECWPRYVDPESEPEKQYNGWPILISQQDNYGRKAMAWLPELKITGIKAPYIEIYNEKTNELIYCIRINENSFKPKTFSKGKYTIRVSDPDKDITLTQNGIQAREKNNKSLNFDFFLNKGQEI